MYLNLNDPIYIYLMEQSNTLMMSLIPIISTVSLLSRSDEFTWISCIPYILPMCIPLIPSLYSWIKRNVSSCGGNMCRRIWKNNTLSFTSRLKLRSWHDEPTSIVRNFSLILWEWNRLNKTVNCKHVVEETGSSRYYNDEIKDAILPYFVDDANQQFWNLDRPDILYTMWVERITDREGISYGELMLRIDFKGPSANPNVIIDHIKFIAKEAKRANSERHCTQRALVSTLAGGKEDAPSRGPPLMAYEFYTTSSFDNFFSEEADIVQKDLTYFLENKASYLRTGRPWTYTVLNEGPPGVGKTKLVKAIAALTGYTLIILNLSHIKNAQMLYEAFHTSVLAGEIVPHEKRLYYIPEVDTQIMTILKSRKDDITAVTEANTAAIATAATATVATTTAATTMAAAAAAITKGGKATASSAPGPFSATALLEDTKPTLGEILNVLDGVPERHGHILILDTNHLAELDAALLRPGRVDRILSWKKMSGNSVRRFLENYYSVKIPADTSFEDYQFTAAELQAKASQNLMWQECMNYPS